VIHTPLPLRRTAALLLMVLPVLLVLSPLGPWLLALLAGLGLLMAALAWQGLGEELAWSLTFALLTPPSWLAAKPGPWWTALARRGGPNRLVTGALDRGEAWGDPEAVYEVALVALGAGPSGLAEAGVGRLRELAEAGHRRAQATLAGALAWGLGVTRDPQAARVLWIRSGGAAEAAIPHPPPSLLRRQATAGTADSPIPEALGRAGERVSGLLHHHGAARWGLGLATLLLLLLLLALPATMMLGLMSFPGLLGQAFRQVAALALVVVLPPLALLAALAFQLRGPRAAARHHRRLLDRAREGDGEAAFNLAGAYAEGGPATPRDLGEARRWYGLAADLGHPVAAYRLAELLLLGLGGPKDRASARAWLQRAAAAGHGPARTQLEALEVPPTDPTPR